MTCATEGCNRQRQKRGFCNACYCRLRYSGTLSLLHVPTPEERFWAKVDKDGPVPHRRPDLGPCWLITDALNASGYGRLTVDGQRVMAHRFSYELLVGPIPEGFEVDHLCFVRHCVRDTHLEAVTHAVNLARSASVSSICAAKTHCPQGHAYDDENTWIEKNGNRHCRTCSRARNREWWHRQKAHAVSVEDPIPCRRSDPCSVKTKRHSNNTNPYRQYLAALAAIHARVVATSSRSHS